MADLGSTDPTPRTLDDVIGAGGSSELPSSPAPPAELSPPTLNVVTQHVEGDLHTLSVHLASPRGAWRAVVFPGRGTELVGARLNGEAPAPLNDGSFKIIGLPSEGIDFVLTVRASGQPTLVVVDQTIVLPVLPGVPSRPEAFMTAPAPADLRGYPTFVVARVTVKD